MRKERKLKTFFRCHDTHGYSQRPIHNIAYIAYMEINYTIKVKKIAYIAYMEINYTINVKEMAHTCKAC